MKTDNIKILYFCKSCKTIMVVTSNTKINIDKLHKMLGMKQCTNCEELNSVMISHIECVIVQKLKYKCTMKCNHCDVRITVNIEVDDISDITNIKKRTEANTSCTNKSCKSKSFTTVSYNMI